MGNIANALWLEGANFLSLYLMSKTCLNDVGNVNNMNNYAACLITYGCEEMALPILQNLNRKYPGSATILNNMAQAWFGLGDLQMASKYIDSALVKIPMHAQANFTKSIIKEKEGNKEEAIEAAKKSLQEGWSDTKLNHLKKLGYQLSRSDIKHSVPQDPMGLHKFQLPQFPKSYDQAIDLSPEWDKFKKSCDDEIKKIEQKIQYASKQQYPGHNKEVIVADGMYKKLHALYSDGDDGWSRKLEKAEEEFEQVAAEIKKMEDVAKKEFQEINKKYEDVCGEGQPCPAAEICKSTKAVHDKFINQANTLFETMINRYVNTHRRFYEGDVYLYQYSASPQEFEHYKLTTQMRFLGLLSVIRFQWMGIMTPADFPNDCGKDKNEGLQKFKGLPDFDEMNCKNISTLNLLFTKIVTRCNKMTTTFKIDGKITGITALKDVKLEIGFTEDLRNNVTILPTEIESGTVEIGVKLGGKEWELGTTKDELKAGVKAEAGVIIEIDKTGITDLGVKTSVSLGGSSTGVPGTDGQGNSGNITLIGAESRWSIHAGPSLKAKSVFKDFTNINNKK
jgi:tetratricopeptide (TPR) repeat protein